MVLRLLRIIDDYVKNITIIIVSFIMLFIWSFFIAPNYYNKMCDFIADYIKYNWN